MNSICQIMMNQYQIQKLRNKKRKRMIQRQKEILLTILINPPKHLSSQTLKTNYQVLHT